MFILQDLSLVVCGMNARKADKGDKIITLRDSTLREGLETPQIRLSELNKIEIFKLLSDLGVSEFEVIGPSYSQKRTSFLSSLNHAKAVKKSGIIPLVNSNIASRLKRFIEFGISHVDLLLHVSEVRLQALFSANSSSKTDVVIEHFQKGISEARKASYKSIGIGLGDVFRADIKLVSSLVEYLTEFQPERFILYDTVGVALPLQVLNLVEVLSQITSVPLFCHFHNDMGMATANTIIALEKGVAGCDVTIGGLGDRSGNASLEEVALIAEHRLGLRTGIKLSQLTGISKTIRKILNLLDERRLPIVGDFAFLHSTPSHFKTILSGQYDAYEPYPPELVGQARCFQISDTSEFTLASKEWCRQRGIYNPRIELLAKRDRGQIVTEKELMELLNGA